ncbi:MAG: hypothetical protein QOH87_3398 [Trebonia sp.]|nr:hypothetical protein [Trebonia sp.]
MKARPAWPRWRPIRLARCSLPTTTAPSPRSSPTRPPRWPPPVPRRRWPGWPAGSAPWRSSRAGPPWTRSRLAASPTCLASSFSGTTARSAGRRACSAHLPCPPATRPCARRCPGCSPCWPRPRERPWKTRARRSPSTRGGRRTRRRRSRCCANHSAGSRRVPRSRSNPAGWYLSSGHRARTREPRCGGWSGNVPPAPRCSAAMTSETSRPLPRSAACAPTASPAVPSLAKARKHRRWPRPPTSSWTARPASCGSSPPLPMWC